MLDIPRLVEHGTRNVQGHWFDSQGMHELH